MSILVVGSVALDTVETPFARREETLGGAASYFSTAASLYSQVNLVAVVGSDFPHEHLDFWRSRPINLSGLQIQEGETFRWVARYHMDMNARDTLDTRLGVYAGFHPVIPAEYLREFTAFPGQYSAGIADGSIGAGSQCAFDRA